MRAGLMGLVAAGWLAVAGVPQEAAAQKVLRVAPIADGQHRVLAEASPYRVMGQAEQLVALRKEVTGFRSSPVIVFWGIDKE